MSERFPDLPLDDTELERLMSEHLEPVIPSVELRHTTQTAMAKHLRGRSRWPWALWGGALIALGALVPALAGGDPPSQITGPAPAPPQPAGPAPTVPDPEPPQDGADLTELVLRLLARETPDVSEDMDYSQLAILLKADVIVAGKVESVDGAGTASLRVHEVLRGQRDELVAISTAGDFNGCEGVPSFKPYLEREVCLFLQRRDKTLTLFHGGAGIQALPFKGKLDRAAIAELALTGQLSEQGLLTLIGDQGLGALAWLGKQMPAAVKQAGTAGVQAIMADALRDLRADSKRQVVMTLARYVELQALPDKALEKLKLYHTTFVAHRWGWVRPPNSSGYANNASDHQAFLKFVGRYDRAWTLKQVEAMLVRIAAGKEHPAHRPAYEALKASFGG